MRDLERLRDAAAALQTLKRELAWAMVRDKERAAHADARSVAEAESKTALQNTELEDLEATCARLLEEKNHALQTQSSARAKANGLRAKHREIEAKGKQAKRDLVELQGEIREINREIQDSRRKVAELDSKAKDAEQEGLGVEEHGRAALISERRALQAKQADLESRVTKLQGLESEQTARQRAALDQLSGARAKRQDTVHALQGLNAQRSRLEAARRDRVRAFGEQMPEVLKAVAKVVAKGAFHRPPIGPIGMHCAMRPEASAWSLPLEAICSRELDNFLVHDHHDRTVLQAVLKKFGASNGILIVSFDRDVDFDLEAAANAARRLHPDARLALEALDISDRVVLKALLINNSIERAVFLDDRSTAVSIMRSRPGSVDVIFTKAYQVRASGHSVSTFPIWSAPNSPSLANDDSSLKCLEILIGSNWLSF